MTLKNALLEKICEHEEGGKQAPLTRVPSTSLPRGRTRIPQVPWDRLRVSRPCQGLPAMAEEIVGENWGSGLLSSFGCTSGNKFD